MQKIILQYEHNTKPGATYTSLSALPRERRNAHPVRFIAYYLPQFHEIPENNEWWGNGFTEWTNTTKALPRYLGHYQPRLPADLGFYDLSNENAILRQIDLATRSGIYGFCIHNYWFSGKRVLETPLEIIYNNKNIDIRYCLNWANESWSRRWDGSEESILLKQGYNPGEDLEYARYVCKFLEDERYIRINGRPLLMIYRPSELLDPIATVERWREFFVRRGVGNPYLVMPQAFGQDDPRAFGMDAAAGFPPHKVGFGARNIAQSLKLLDSRFTGHVVWYDDIVKNALSNHPTEYRLFPGVFPQWDNEARKPNRGFSVAGSTPEKYQNWLLSAARRVSDVYDVDERIVFINAWNEWAEGAYLEPDRHYGASYLLATSQVSDMLLGERDPQAHRSEKAYSPLDVPSPSRFNGIHNTFQRILRRKSTSA